MDVYHTDDDCLECDAEAGVMCFDWCPLRQGAAYDLQD